MSHQTFNHDSWRLFMMRWYIPAVTLFFLCGTISSKGILAEPTPSGHIRGVQLPQKASSILPKHKNEARRQRRLELEDPCQQTYSNDYEGGMTRGISTCIETTMSNGCDKARVMPDDGTQIVMNTTNAPLLGPQCNSTFNGKGYWFEITGKGRNVIISTCHEETLIPTVISVYPSSEGGCGMQRSCSEFKTTTTSDCFPLQFFADKNVIYKISVMGDMENTHLAELEDQMIALSITREVTCPCWSASELLSTTPITNEYLAQSCNTIIHNPDDNLGDLNSTTGSIFILDAFDEGAKISRIGFNQSYIECSLQGSLISRSIHETILDDEVEACLALLHDRCAELSFEGAVWSMFQEACSLENFVDTILRSDDDLDMEEYMDCLKVGTNVPTALPSRKPGMDHQHHQP